MEAMARRMKAQPEKFELRKQLAEYPFGTLNRWFGYDHFLLKGLAKVRTEWSLMTLAYNLKRVLPVDWVVFGLVLCSVVGIIFGTCPAWKASNLDPIESLRYE